MFWARSQKLLLATVQILGEKLGDYSPDKDFCWTQEPYMDSDTVICIACISQALTGLGMTQLNSDS